MEVCGISAAPLDFVGKKLIGQWSPVVFSSMKLAKAQNSRIANERNPDREFALLTTAKSLGEFRGLFVEVNLTNEIGYG